MCAKKEEFYAHWVGSHDRLLNAVELSVTDAGLQVKRQLPGELFSITLSNEHILHWRLVSWRRQSNCLVKLTYYQRSEQPQQKPDRLDNKLVLTKQSLSVLFESEDTAKRFIKVLGSFTTAARLGRSERKPYLIFINPRSGSGKALKLFRTQVAPVFQRKGIPFEVIKTKYAGHAEQWVATCQYTDLLKYRALIAVSGDGLIYEIINGLAARNELESHPPIRLPIGTLPAGGGNAIAGSVCYFSGLSPLENYLLHSAFILMHDAPPVRELSKTSEAEMKTNVNNSTCEPSDDLATYQKIVPLDALLFESANGKSRRLGVLSIEWGGMADMDVKSEIFRWMGRMRFAVSGFFTMIRPKRYRARVAYLPYSSEKKTKLPNSIPASTNHDDGIQNATYKKGDTLDVHTQLPDRLKWQYLPELNHSIPDDWVKVEEDFWSILVMNQTHIANDCLLFPEPSFNKGYLNLVLIYSGVKPWHLRALSNMMVSGHGLTDTSFWRIIPIVAIRVEPLSPRSVYTMLDGERVDSGPFQLELVPELFSILTCPVESPSANKGD
ncbi:unnamed protein product [Calicophoron daubneyi]|uniref:DAGKc domain-containing protein n=1 Tax=Calicophoron daubneyi TaxID=300641 RepID=A0AAV2T4G8_CALDB